MLKSKKVISYLYSRKQCAVISISVLWRNIVPIFYMEFEAVRRERRDQMTFVGTWRSSLGKTCTILDLLAKNTEYNMCPGLIVSSMMHTAILFINQKSLSCSRRNNHRKGCKAYVMIL
jgi:hypothetical protein